MHNVVVYVVHVALFDCLTRVMCHDIDAYIDAYFATMFLTCVNLSSSFVIASNLSMCANNSFTRVVSLRCANIVVRIRNAFTYRVIDALRFVSSFAIARYTIVSMCRCVVTSKIAFLSSCDLHVMTNVIVSSSRDTMRFVDVLLFDITLILFLSHID